MNEAQPGINDDAPLDATREQMMTEIFAHMVIQNTNMALMFLGAMPHPETDEKMRDLQAAQMFIAQLEMLAVKTAGNLAPEEQKLLQQSLMHLQVTFVEAMENPPKAEAVKVPEAATPDEAESSKRFSKKF